MLYARLPRRGDVKTRMVPWMTDMEALDLHRALLEDSLHLLRDASSLSGAEPIFAPSETWGPELLAREPTLARLVEGIRQLPQSGSDLGERLLGTFEALSESGTPAAVIFGSDSPTLPPGRFVEAFAHLRRGDGIVLGPAEDGGFYLIGARRPPRRIFTGVRWGGATVLADTIEGLRGAGIAPALLGPWYDVDRPEDLPRLRADLDAGASAVSTRACLDRLRARRPFSRSVP